MIRLPPSPPLFPYTTLFRSILSASEGAYSTERIRRHDRGPDPQEPHILLRFGGKLPATSGLDATLGDGSATGFSADRKSTRLNSSHRTISYAVFCLKKKKKP